jgi:hypothetical protein
MNTLVASLALVMLAPAAAAPPAPGLPILEDDFDRARAEAKARAVPLFVEVWAPW